MMRSLTNKEVESLIANGCEAEDWNLIQVAEGFAVDRVHNVNFYGQIRLGSNAGKIEVVDGFEKTCGLRNVTLYNVCVGDDSLIEDTTLIACSVKAEEDHVIPVLNEAGDGNVVLFPSLSSQMASLQIRYEKDAQFTAAFRQLVRQLMATGGGMTYIGHHTCISGAGKLVNCQIGNHCYIGENVILEGCYVAETSTVTNGFMAEHSLFFANTFVANGEACAAFCGPFTASHHKGSLLIGVELSFYNAGSATNYSNHAYKMGPLHYGTLQRGSKTASGAHLLLPAQTGPFTMCMGKIQSHPDTRNMPFSYLIASGDDTMLIPARGLLTAGLYRDVNKWPKRDKRPADDRPSLISHQWLSPFTLQAIRQGKSDLEALLESHPETDHYRYHGCKIKRHALLTGIKIYDLALRLAGNPLPTETWSDLGGMLLPLSEELQLVEEVKSGKIASIAALQQALEQIHQRYDAPQELNAECVEEWLNYIRMDAQKEFDLGDVDQEVLDSFLSKLK